MLAAAIEIRDVTRWNTNNCDFFSAYFPIK
jgi:hypothetical protein